MTKHQPLITNTPKRASRYLYFSLKDGHNPRDSLHKLATKFDPETMVVGIGQSLCTKLKVSVPSLSFMPDFQLESITLPTSHHDLWIWLNGDDRGALFHQARQWQKNLAEAFTLQDSQEAFIYDQSRDLTGYEDGTENPEGDDALEAAILMDQDSPWNGSSFVALQKWQHNFAQIDQNDDAAMDDIIGRRRQSNEEFDEAPRSAHVKRSAQESFDPEAFMVRRSMPWIEGEAAGLIFVAFGHSFQAFEQIFNRMLGHEDGLPDALFQVSQPIDGGYFWCPGLNEKGHLNISNLN